MGSKLALPMQRSWAWAPTRPIHRSSVTSPRSSASILGSPTHAAQMMMAEDTHHVMVVSPNEQLVGVVSTRDIVGWLRQTDGP